MPEAVIFDVDGTLIDSVDLHAKAWVDAFHDLGARPGAADFRHGRRFPALGTGGAHPRRPAARTRGAARSPSGAPKPTRKVPAVIAIPEGRRLRPKALLEAWIDQAGVADGFVFRRLGVGGTVTPQPMSDRAIARMVQARAAAAGYTAADFAGHSLRAGFLTAAARSGASVFKMREVSRHKSMQVLADYVCDAELFRDHAGDGFL